LILGVLDKVARDVGAERDGAEVIRARKFEGGTGEFRGQAVAAEGLGHFRVVQRDVIRKTVIGEHGALALDDGFEALSGDIVFDGDVVEV